MTNCAGVITWMHTFSPAKSWILGLTGTDRKPLLHLHTQYNREIPYDTIDMDFMNENQSAHGDREYGHIVLPSAYGDARWLWVTGQTNPAQDRIAFLDAHSCRCILKAVISA